MGTDADVVKKLQAEQFKPSEQLTLEACVVWATSWPSTSTRPAETS